MIYTVDFIVFFVLNIFCCFIVDNAEIQNSPTLSGKGFYFVFYIYISTTICIVCVFAGFSFITDAFQIIGVIKILSVEIRSFSF